ncbi:MAG: hypothetical protein GF308_15695 [Candidatus Heimdallarchaeota archaeon]|nr:hypothetical protein [Candidatus Heimdallarchaeota archaeon]
MSEEETLSNTPEKSQEKTGKIQLVCDVEGCRVHKSLWEVIKLPWWEYPIVAGLIGATITMFVLHTQMKENHGYTIGLVVTASLLGIWFAFRPSEWAVDGLDNVMRYVGLTAYVAGVISSLASNLPEAVAAGIMLVRGAFGSAQGTMLGHELVMTAFYTTLAAAGFNAILLGLVVLVGSKEKSYIEVKKETIVAEGVLLRWGFVATLLTFGVAVIVLIDRLFAEIKAGTNFVGIEELTAELPRMAGISLVVSYLIYLTFLIVKSKQAKIDQKLTIIERPKKPTRSKLDEKMPDKLPMEERTTTITTTPPPKKVLDEPEEINILEERDGSYESDIGEGLSDPFISGPHMEHPHVTFGTSIVLVILGITGIAGGGFLLSHSVEMSLETIDLDVEIMALIVGFSGAVPEHGIAVVAAAQGKTDVALGNLLGGILQMTLLIFGAFATIVRAPINDFMIFQLIALAGILWFIKRAITDDGKISIFEGIMILLAQTFSFLLLIGELTGLGLF